MSRLKHFKHFKYFAFLLLCLLNVLLLSSCLLEPGALIIRPDPSESASPAPSAHATASPRP